MSTIRATYVQHGSSSVPNITLNASGQVVVASGIVSSGTFAAPSGSAAAPGVYFDGDTDTGLYSPSANQVAVATSGTARLTVDDSGRLLVGTTSASGSAFFHVQGRSGSPTDYAPISLRRGSLPSAGSQALGVISFTDNSENIGAQIFAESDGGSWTSGSNHRSRIIFATTADGASSPTERMRISNKGKTTLTSVADNDLALSVAHNGTSGTQYGVSITTANDQNSNSLYFLQCIGGATNRATVLTNGGLQNYQANNVNLSDINTKKDISPAAGTWDCIKEWEIVNYRYKDQPSDAALNLGVIAQQVAESCPEVITVFQEATEDEPEKLGVKEQQMYWMAIKALQEAQYRIETLEAKVAAMETP